MTLVEDYYQQAVPQGITYDQIILAIKGDSGGHIKSDGGAANEVRSIECCISSEAAPRPCQLAPGADAFPPSSGDPARGGGAP